MEDKKFKLFNRLGAAVALVVSAFTYLSTIEPTASFWDCGEFIASSYKLEVGHPPGNPVFQLVARLFTMFGDNMHAAMLVNAMSALCSALTIFLLYLTIVWFVKRLIRKEEGGYTAGEVIAIIGSGLVGSLAYCFSDTFWFSAVEGEVYAMSSLVTALVFWAMTRWYDAADEPHANRWIVLIALLMGLSIGIHLLNLLAIPALVFMYYFRKREDGTFRFGELLKIFLVGVVILALVLFVVIPLLPKTAAYFDLFFVNVLSLPYNSGAAFFLLLVLGLCFWGLFVSLKKEKVFLNTALLCLTAIIIGFSIFSVDVIRSCVKTPTNENQPDNAFTLVRYLDREQYGKAPLVYGQYFDAPYELETPKYWTPMGGKYKKVDAPVAAKYKPSGKMLFPRMWSDSSPSYIKFYERYTHGKGHKLRGATRPKPTMGANLAYFFDYQLNWMYWRYFMWNFVGRQNDIHSPVPGEAFYGNWESGIGFLDNIRLGDQSKAPSILRDNKGKNHYFFLPFLLGLLGLFFQFRRDRRGCWLTFLMFFMTGIAIVMYLNQPPYQVRERDYAYAGSFYFFSIWIGLAVAALYSSLSEVLKGRGNTVASAAVAVVLLGVPTLMACQNWDDHDRSGRRTAPELARNYLNSVGENGMLVTHGDNDTFPLWYAQEVENVRTDVRICNTSLLGTDWYIDQMKYACNESAPLPLRVDLSQYLYGTNDFVPIYDVRNQVMSIEDVMSIFRHPSIKVPLSSGRKVDYIASRKISIPVNAENAVRSGIVAERYADRIPSEIIIEIPAGKDHITKQELFMLDLLSGYDWSRPLHMLNKGGDIDLGIRKYLEYVGYSYRLIPFGNEPAPLDPGFVDAENLYSKMSSVYSWDALSSPGYFVDYQNIYTNMGVMNVRELFVEAAQVFISEGWNDRAKEMLDKGVAVLDKDRYPYDGIPIGLSNSNYMVVKMISLYYRIGEVESARALAKDFAAQLRESVAFFSGFYEYAKSEFDAAMNYTLFLCDEMNKAGDGELAAELLTAAKKLI